MNKYGITASLTAVAVFTAVMPQTAEASTNLDLRKKVIGLTGITTVTGLDASVTRAEFAQMLVNATAYKSVLTQTSSTSVFSDVPQTSEYASAVRIAVENGWMTGYLGGVFKPDQWITLQEAIRGVLALLGYTDSDFTGDQIGGRLSKYYYLDLSEEISRQAYEVLDKTDCINLFYNLLTTETTSGKAYCTTLGYELTSDGEVNALTIADNSLKGPKVVRKSGDLSDAVPFDLTTATFYLDGRISSLEAVKQAKNEDFIVVYYSTSARTVWAYRADNSSETGKQVIRGNISGIYYSSSNVLTPSGVILDDDTSVEYKLTDSEMQFAFSIYGSLKVGDDVILICDVTTGSNGDANYTVVDYIEY